MKRISVLLAAGLLLMAVPTAVFAADEVFKADLTAGAEVPPVTADGTGKATVTIAGDESTVSWDVTYSALTGDAAAGHIHFGGADVSGPVMIPFATVSATGSTGTFAKADYATGEGLPDDWAGVLAAIRDGEAYVNIHTAANKGGEIRGQLAASSSPNPPSTDTMSEATGSQAPAPLGVLLAVAALGAAIGVRRFARR